MCTPQEGDRPTPPLSLLLSFLFHFKIRKREEEHPLESSNEDVLAVHNGTKKLDVLGTGTLVAQKSWPARAMRRNNWYREKNGYNGVEPLVTYIQADADDVYSFQYETFEAPKDYLPNLGWGAPEPAPAPQPAKRNSGREVVGEFVTTRSVRVTGDASTSSSPFRGLQGRGVGGMTAHTWPVSSGTPRCRRGCRLTRSRHGADAFSLSWASPHATA